MQKEFPITPPTAYGINPLFCGHEVCEKNHRFGPALRDYYLIHFCLSGKGKLFDKYGEHEIKKGQLFVIRPSEVTKYVADSVTPWEYVWIAFEGQGSNVFNTTQSVYSTPSDIATQLRSLVEENVFSCEIYLSLLYALIHHLFAPPHDHDAVLHAKRYIEYNYMNDIKVSDMAKTFGFERSYLYRLFKMRFHVGIKEYLIQVRMENAKKFLEKGLPVASVAYMVGYKDEFNFSKAFKKTFAIPPSRYKTEK